MTEWWNGIPVFERLFWYFALPFSAVFLLQIILTLLGLDWHHDGFDVHDGGGLEHDGGSDAGAGFRLFTLRNFIIFFTGFGWAGIFAIRAGLNHLFAILLAFMVGLFLMVMVAGIFYFISRLTESGNINLTNALNASGRVYLPVPGRRTGIGQVQIAIQGSTREVQAMTDEDDLATGTPVMVTEVQNDDILIVKKS